MKKSSQGFIVLMILMFLTACGGSAARYNNAGNSEYESENYTEAVENYVAAQREDPDLPQPYYNAGNAYHRQGNFDSAAAQTKQSVRTAEDELAQNSYYNLGNTYFKIEDWEAAIDAYKEALRLNPDDEEAKYNLELALKNLQEQQQQQQQQGGGGQPPPPEQNQGGGQNQEQNQGQGGEQQQEQGGGGQPEQDENGQSGSQEQGNQPQPGPRGLTPQEAEQLLDALGQDSQTLQERLQQGFFAPGLPPSKDW